MSEFFTTSNLIQLATALTGSLGFALIFRAKAKYLPAEALLGCFAQLIYLLTIFWGGSDLTAAILATTSAGVLAEILSKIADTPLPVFLLPGIIPIVPGSALYYAMYALVSGDYGGFSHFAGITLRVASGIAIGSVFASILTVWTARSIAASVRIRKKLQKRRPQ